MPTAREIAIIIKAVDKASAELRAASGEVKKLGAEAKSASSGTEKIGNALRGIGKEALIMGVAVAGTATALYKLGEAGAAATQTAESFEMLMDNLGAAPDILTQMTAAVGGTVSEMDLMSATMTLVAGASDELAISMVDAAPRLLEIAKAANKLNPSLGSTTFLYESLARGIKRSSPLILDNTGLVIKVGEANEAYAESLGVTVEALSATDKQQALLNAALEAGNVLIDQVGGNTDSATDSFAQFKTEAKELGTEIAQELGPAVGELVGGLGDMLRTGRENRDMLDDMADMFGANTVHMALMNGTIGELEQSYLELETAAGEMGPTLEEITQGTTAATDGMLALAEADEVSATSIENASTRRAAAVDRIARQTARANAAIMASYKLLGAVIDGAVGDANEKYIEQQGDIESQLTDLRAELADYERQNGIVVTSQQDVALSTEDTILAMAKAEDKAAKLATAQQRLADNTDPDKQLALEAALIRASRAYDRVSGAVSEAGSYTTDYSEQIGGIQGEIAELEGSLVSLEAQHRQTMNSIIFGMIEARLAADGWTEAEVNLAWQIAESMGIIDKATLDAITSSNAIISEWEAGLIDAEGVIDDVTAAVDEFSGTTGESREIVQGLTSDIDLERQEIVELIGEYDRVQPIVETKILQDGMGAAREAVRGYTWDLEHIPTTIRTTIVQAFTREGVSEIDVVGAPRMAAGTPYVPDNGLAFLHQGEAVLPREEAAAYRAGLGGGGGGTVVIAPIILERSDYTDANGDVMFEAIAEIVQAQQGAF